MTSRASRPSLVFLGFGVLATALFLFLPATLANVWIDVVGISAILAMVVGILRNKPQNPSVWWALVLGQVLFVAGDITWTYYEEVLHRESPFPSIADVSYLFGYVPLTLGLVMMVRARRPGRDLTSFVDAAVITVAAAVSSWVFLMAPQVAASGATVTETVVSLAYPFADILMIGVVASLMFTTDMRAFSYRLICVSLIALITADTLYTFAEIRDWYATGSSIDTGWLLSYVCWGAAALHPSMRKLTERNTEVTTPRFTRRRLAIEAGAVVAIPLLRVVQAIRHAPGHGTILAVGSAVAGILIIFRMGGLLTALESAALHDPLTGLPNRRLLLDRISQAFRRAERSRTPVAVLFLDLGGFKKINDRFGHEVGDQALIEIGKRVVSAVRSSDTVARLGGDEFVVVCEGLRQDQAESLGFRVRADVAAPLEINNEPIELRVDLGIAVEMAPEHGDVKALLAAADRAMYRAKEAAKGSTKQPPAPRV